MVSMIIMVMRVHHVGSSFIVSAAAAAAAASIRSLSAATARPPPLLVDDRACLLACYPLSVCCPHTHWMATTNAPRRLHPTTTTVLILILQPLRAGRYTHTHSLCSM